MYTFSDIVFNFVSSHKVLLVAYIIVLIIMPLQDIGIPHIIGKLMESLRSNGKSDYNYAYALVAMILLVQVGYTVNDYIEVKIYPLFQKYICNKILKYIFEKSSVNLQDILIGKILSIMAHAPRTMYNYLDIYRTEIFPQIIVFIIALVYLAMVDYHLAAIMLCVVIIYYIVVYLTLFKCKEPSQIRENYLIKVNEEVDDVLTNIVGILNAGQKYPELKTLNKYYDMYQKYGEISMKCTLKYKFALVPVMLISLVVFILLGFSKVKSKQIKVEKLVVCIIIYLYVFNSILKAINDIRDMAIRGGMVAEHLKIFESMTDPPENTSPIRKHDDKYLYFDNITLKHGEKTILNNFSLNIKKGEKLLIIGQIGSGKTTILKLLMRYSNPNSGHLYYKGIPFENIPRVEIRKKIGYIPQSPMLLNRTLLENITYGSPNVSKEQVLDLISKLELSHIFNEARLNQNVGKHGSKLSGGQRQVVWILRVLIQNPEILIMDEPTSAIDKDTKSFIDRLFEHVMKDRTTIVVSHDEYMSKLCDKTIKIG